jgi:hypothetical protein
MARVSQKGFEKRPFFPPYLHVCHQFGNTQKAANEVPIEVCKTEEDLNIMVACRFWPLSNCQDPVQLHLNTFWCYKEVDKTDILHFEFAL